MISVTIDCPCCCAACDNSEECCDFDIDVSAEPSCETVCCFEQFTQSITRQSSTDNCQDCEEVFEELVQGCNEDCICDCSLLGEGWSSVPPEFCDYILEAEASSEEAGCPCISEDCYKCDEGPEGCYAVVSVAGSPLGGGGPQAPTCTTNFSLNFIDTSCRQGTLREVAELGVDISLTVTCPENNECAGVKPDVYGLSDCIYSGSDGASTVTYKFEDCSPSVGSGAPDFLITITLEECDPEECD